MLRNWISCLGQEGSISVDWKIAGQNIDSNFHLILQTCIGTVQVPITYTYFHIYFSLFTTSCHSGIRTQILEYDGPIDVIINSLNIFGILFLVFLKLLQNRENFVEQNCHRRLDWIRTTDLRCWIRLL